MPAAPSLLLRFAALCLLSLLVACGGAAGKRTPRDQALYDYVSAVRWSDFDRAVTFIDPVTKETSPMSATDLERYKQFQITGYEVRTADSPSETEYEQVVEVRMINKHTQAERVVTDRQRWRWDEEAKRWWLVTGLPPLEAR